jgi:hypothetical protein
MVAWIRHEGRIYNAMKSLSDFQNIHSGQRCFVIGNGPSLNRIDLSLLRSEITFGSNRVYHGFPKWGFGFTYWSIEDMMVAEDIADEWTSRMVTEPPYPSTIFVPGDLLHLVHAQGKPCVNPCIPVNFTRNEFYPQLFPFSIDPGQISWGGTVTYLLLQLAAIMGCNPIILLGIDFNYVIPATVRRLKPYQLVSTEDDPNHFFPEYFGKGRKWHDPFTPRMKVAYISAARAAKRHGFSILNATPGTKLKVFRRIDFRDAIEGTYGRETFSEKVERLAANVNWDKLKSDAAEISKRAKSKLLQRSQLGI